MKMFNTDLKKKFNIYQNFKKCTPGTGLNISFTILHFDGRQIPSVGNQSL